MIPYDLDPTLHATEPQLQVLDDGFSPPHPESREAIKPPPQHSDADENLGLGEKSLF